MEFVLHSVDIFLKSFQQCHIAFNDFTDEKGLGFGEKSLEIENFMLVVLIVNVMFMALPAD